MEQRSRKKKTDGGVTVKAHPLKLSYNNIHHMANETPYCLHGYSPKVSLRSSIRHEAGHALLVWLHDRYLIGVAANEHGGLTAQVLFEGQKISFAMPLLLTLAGMHMGNDSDVVFDLRDHIGEKDYFGVNTDSAFIAEFAQHFDADPLPVFIHADLILSRFRTRFRKAYNELVKSLTEAQNNQIGPEQAYELYGKWDTEYGFDKHPKSDFVMRSVAREFKIQLPKCKWVDWDMKPLEGWKYTRPSLQKVMSQAKKQLDADCKGEVK